MIEVLLHAPWLTEDNKQELRQLNQEAVEYGLNVVASKGAITDKFKYLKGIIKNYLDKKPKQNIQQTVSFYMPAKREYRSGLKEIAVITNGLPQALALQQLVGGKEGMFNMISAIAQYWDEHASPEECREILREYTAWCLSHEGIEFQRYFGKRLPFWKNI